MTVELELLPSVAQQVQQHLNAAAAEQRPRFGWLVGICHSSTVTIISSIRSARTLGPGTTPDYAQDFEEVRALVPHGITIVGAFTMATATVTMSSSTGFAAPTISPAVPPRTAAEETMRKLASILPQAEVPFITAVLSAGALSFFASSGGSCEPVSASTLPNSDAGGPSAWLTSRFSLLRCRASVLLRAYDLPDPPALDRTAFLASLPATGADPAASSAIAAAVSEAERELCGPSTVFMVSSATGRESSSSGQGGGLVLGDGAAASGGTVGDMGWDRQAVVELVPLVAGPGEPGPSCAPSLEYQPIKGGTSRMHCCAAMLDVLCYAPHTMPVDKVASTLLRPALRSQLAAVRRILQGQRVLTTTRALHFQPPGWPHHVTALYALPLVSFEAAEEGMRAVREGLHRRLGLPLDRPMLRVANAVQLGGDGGPDGGGGGSEQAGRSARLRNVHVGVAPSGVKGGSVHLVSGDLEYYHYMQDKFNDAGWGCAYRSLQTIISWFKLQSYTSTPVPTHRDIQQALVKIGDKDPTFLGSKKWIGAIELGYVLDSLLGLQCKVLQFRNGLEIPTQARQIAQHFDTQGTPIMIGGGVLAYTLLGIDWNEATGECAFLILDPHYTGADDLKRVQSGQWVAWKRPGDRAAAGGDLFVSDAHYNFLCPQRPSTV